MYSLQLLAGLKLVNTYKFNLNTIRNYSKALNQPHSLKKWIEFQVSYFLHGLVKTSKKIFSSQCIDILSKVVEEIISALAEVKKTNDLIERMTFTQRVGFKKIEFTAVFANPKREMLRLVSFLIETGKLKDYFQPIFFKACMYDWKVIMPLLLSYEVTKQNFFPSKLIKADFEILNKNEFAAFDRFISASALSNITPSIPFYCQFFPTGNSEIDSFIWENHSDLREYYKGTTFYSENLRPAKKLKQNQSLLMQDSINLPILKAITSESSLLYVEVEDKESLLRK